MIELHDEFKKIANQPDGKVLSSPKVRAWLEKVAASECSGAAMTATTLIKKMERGKRFSRLESSILLESVLSTISEACEASAKAARKAAKVR